MKFFEIIFWVPKPVYHSPKPFGYSVDCESGFRDGNEAFYLFLKMTQQYYEILMIECTETFSTLFPVGFWRRI